MGNRKRKFDEIDVNLNTFNNDLFEKSGNYLDSSLLPSVCYQRIFRYLPIESVVSVALTCKTWYNILSSDTFCYHKSTKLILSNESQLISASNSRILRHVNKMEIGTYHHGLVINTSFAFQFQFTSLYSLKLCFKLLSQSFIVNLFHSISSTLGKFILAMQPSLASTSHREYSDPIASCHLILESLYLLRNLTHFSILVKSSAKIEFDIDKYFKHLAKLQTLIIRQDNYTHKRSRMQQLLSIKHLPCLTHLEWFEILPHDLEVLSSISSPPHLQHIHLQETLITNELLLNLSKIPSITSLKSDRFSPIKSILNVNGFSHLLALKETLQDLEISAKRINYDELQMIQHPTEVDYTEDEYEVYLTVDHINVLKQFVCLKFLSLNKIIVTRECMDNLLMHLSQYNRLKILYLESMCFPSFMILSTIHSLEELSLSYPYNHNSEEYTDRELLMLYPLKNLKVLILFHSMNLSKGIRKQLQEKTLKISQSATPSDLIFEQLDEFIYNNNDNNDDSDEEEEDDMTENA